MKKKILAGLLALCMIFSMVPMSAFAAADTDTQPADTEGTIGVEAYGFMWEQPEQNADIEGTDCQTGDDWMAETMWVAMDESTPTGKNLWFEVTVGTDVWGCAATTSAKRMFAFSFLNRGNQWELHPEINGETFHYDNQGVKHATAYMGTHVDNPETVTLKVYSTEKPISDELTSAPSNLGEPILTKPISITKGEDVVEVIPTIKKAGFAWYAEAANTGFVNDIKEIRKDDNYTRADDADDQSMWMVCAGLKNNTEYTFKVTSGSNTYFTDTVTASNTTDNKNKPAWIWSPLDGGNLSNKSFSKEGGEYTISLYEGKNVTEGAKAVATATVTVPENEDTLTATGALSSDKKTLTVTLSKALRGEYKVELLKGSDEAATAQNVFLNGKEITFTSDSAFTKGSYKIKVSTRNSTPVTMVEAQFTVSGPVPTIVPAPIVDHPATGETEKTNLGTVTVGTVTDDAAEENTYSFTLTGTNIVPHKNAQGDEGPWVGFGMPIEDGSTYSYSYKKGAEDTDYPLASVKDRVYEDEDGNKYNTIYFDVAGDYTVTQTATKDGENTVVTYKVKVVINVAPITLTVAKVESDNLLGKNTTDLQDITVATADKKIAITGTSKYVADYTGFSSNATEQKGNYIALTLEAKQNSNAVKSVWVKNSKNAWVKVDDTDHTHVIRLNNYNTKTIDVAISKDTPTKADYTLDINGLTIEPAPAEGLGLNVTASTGILNDLGGKAVSELQEKVVVATPSELVPYYTVNGEANYILGWEDFSSVEAEQYGHYVALTFTSGPDTTIKVKDGPTLDPADGILVKRLENFTGNDKKLTIVVSKTGETDKKYTIDYSKVVMKPAEISAVESKMDDVTAAYNNGTVTLSGTVAKFGETETTKEITLEVTVNGVKKEVKTNIKKTGNVLSVDSMALYGNTLTFDTSMLVEKKDTAADKATVAPPTADVAEGLTGEKATAAGTVAEALTAEDAATEVEKAILQKYADVAANDAAAKDTLLTSANSIVTTNAAKVPDGVKTAITDAAKADATPEQKAAVTTVVQVYTKIEVKDVETTGETVTGFTVDITPMAQTVILAISKETIDENTEIKLFDPEKTKEENATANAIQVGEDQPVDIKEPTLVKLALPAGAFEDGTVYVRHTKDNGTSYLYNGTVESDVLSFTSMHGFSLFAVSTNVTDEAKIGDTVYETLDKAVAAVKDGETITLLNNIAADRRVTVSGNSRNFTIDTNGKTFAITNISGATATNDSSPFSFTYTRPTPSGPPSGGGSTVTTYPITAPTATGGKVSVSSTAAAGATVTITTTPDEGKVTDAVTVTDANGKAVTVTKAADNKYTFVMPAGAVKITATFKDAGDEPTPPDDWKNPYSDVTTKPAWAYEAIKFVTEKKMMQDTGSGKFEPNTKLTRGMFARILYNYKGSPAVTGTVDYKDFQTGKWYSNAVIWATQNGVLKGLDGNRIGVDTPITREQLVVMLWRYVGEPKASADVTVNGNPSNFAVEAMRWAVANGVIKGDENGNHNPKNTATRAEVARILYNYFGQEK